MNQPATKIETESPAFHRGIHEQMAMTRSAVAAVEDKDLKDAVNLTRWERRGFFGRLRRRRPELGEATRRSSRGRSGADGARTRDLLAASQTLSQLSYGPKLRSNSSVQSAKGLSPQPHRTATRFRIARGRLPPG